ncbi:hypothetical protein CPT_Pascal29 [Bacillus phage Pascal]|uniref:Uncharacterized protein n=1 Tax=Bacillus phage Pascal TaxID=1540092 RepID=A0A0A0RPV2_9CAUD|nr:hypothetical protein CPT_Pascal29 [Bacillus phage Pascal]AIW03664.1 hypothetical protein CPT_Pascal29 [Bacillus phage Pascal]
MKTVEEQLKDYIDALVYLHSISEKDMKDSSLSKYSQTLATAEEYTYRNIIQKLREIK